MPTAGIDGCKQGWVAVVIGERGFERAVVAADFAALRAELGAVDVVGVDMPIGLVDRGWRACDLAAREALGSARSRVFPMPPRPALEAPTYDQALTRCRALCDGTGLSKQAYGLRRKIFEVEACADDAVFEVHPELAFAHMNGGEPLPSKKTWRGLAARVELLAQHGVRVPATAATGGAAADDVVDAAAVAWSAARIAAGDARSYPARATQHDGKRPILIWA